MTKNAMKVWMDAATTDEQREMAAMVGSSRGYLYHIAGGFRKASTELAALIEEATKEMHKRSKGRLPVIYRTDLSSACAACQFARKCIGMKAEFPLLGEGV